jgi:hypothetical protein
MSWERSSEEGILTQSLNLIDVTVTYSLARIGCKVNTTKIQYRLQQRLRIAYVSRTGLFELLVTVINLKTY